jgi:hypothetical protein
MKRVIVTSILVLLAVLGYAKLSFGYKPDSGKAVLFPVTISGTVVSSFSPYIGLADAIVTLSNSVTYTTTTTATGQFSIPAVQSDTTYSYIISHTGYQDATGDITVAGTDFNMGTIALNEVIPPPQQVEASQSLDQNQVSLVWMPASPVAAYRIWRFLIEEEANETAWTLLGSVAIADTSFTDTNWDTLPNGIYKYAVKAVYVNNIVSEAALSNEVRKGMLGLLSGTVRESGSNIPLAGATISAGGYLGYTNSLGNYSFLVYVGTYNVSCTKPGYQPFQQSGVVITGSQTTTLNIELICNTLMPTSVLAEVVINTVHLSWTAPGMGESQWIHYDNGLNDDSIGTGGAADFDVAIRFPVSYLDDFAGMSLYAVKIWPAQPGNFSVRVWRGGNSTAPSIMVTDQIISPVLGQYNTIMLNSPVAITGTQELWFGYRCNVSGGFPAGCDSGPAINGYGNMLRYDGIWSTLLDFSANLNSNWNIQGYVGFAPPTSAPLITQAGLFAVAGNDALRDDYRVPTYKVWRLHPGEENNQSLWTSITPNAITATSYVDSAWPTLPYGSYKWAVKAIYPGEVYSDPAFSNSLAMIAQIGTISGLVRTASNQAIPGAVVVCGDISTTTNSSGAYSMEVPAGVHSVIASHAFFVTTTISSVSVLAGLISSVNFTLPIGTGDTFEGYPDFSLNFFPWTLVDVDYSLTIGMGESSWDNINSPQAFIIFNPGATVPPITDLSAHGGEKMACSFGSSEGWPLNDWLISPALNSVGRISFWARSATNSEPLAKFKVGISLSVPHPSAFTIISGDEALEAPAEWTEYVYYISPSNPTARFAINCRTVGANTLCIDDFASMRVDSDDPYSPPADALQLSNYPNPFNLSTTIGYKLEASAPVKVEILNTKGQLVKSLESADKAAGSYSTNWNGTDNGGRSVASGIYYCRISAGKQHSIRKMLLIK